MTDDDADLALYDDEDDIEIAPNGTLHDQLGPTSLDEYVGQQRAKTRLAVHIAAAKQSDEPLPHVLLSATPGAGKTTLARLIGGELGRDVAEVARPCSPNEFVEYLYETDGEGVVIIDEVHRWSLGQQRSLLTLMEEGFIELKWGREEFADLTIIAATTEIQKLDPAFVDRFPIQPPFTPYTEDELALIVTGMCTRAGLAIDGDTRTVLARACSGVPRIARSLVVAARDLTQVMGTVPTGEAILDFCQIEPDGLSVDHLAYMNVLNSAANGQAGLNVLSTRLRMHPQRVAELERILIDRNYIGLDTRGRVLTAKGRKRVRGIID